MLSGGSAVTMATFSAPLLVQVADEHARHLARRRAEHLGAAAAHRTASTSPTLPQVRLAVFGGAPAPPGTLDRVRARMPQLRLFDVYALSETCAPVTVLPDAEAAPASPAASAARRRTSTCGSSARTAPTCPAASRARCGCAPRPSRPATGAPTARSRCTRRLAAHRRPGPARRRGLPARWAAAPSTSSSAAA